MNDPEVTMSDVPPNGNLIAYDRANEGTCRCQAPPKIFHLRFPTRFRGCLAPSVVFRYVRGRSGHSVSGVGSRKSRGRSRTQRKRPCPPSTVSEPGTPKMIRYRFPIRLRGCLAPSVMFRYARGRSGFNGAWHPLDTGFSPPTPNLTSAPYLLLMLDPDTDRGCCFLALTAVAVSCGCPCPRLRRPNFGKARHPSAIPPAEGGRPI